MHRFLLILLIFAVPLSATAFEVSGHIDGAEGLQLIVVVALPVTLDTLYISAAIPILFTYSLANLDSGGYVLGAYHDANINGLPDLGESYGFYGGELPEVLTVNSDLEGIDIELREPTTGGFQGAISYLGEQTGLTMVLAYDNPEFTGTPSGAGLLFNNTGNGNYTAITDTQGVFYAFAFMDLNANFQYDTDEPYGVYGGETPAPITVSAPDFPDDIHIEMIGVETAVPRAPVETLPEGFELGSPYPNPFNAQTTIPVTLSRAADVTLRIYDLLGREAGVIHSGPLSEGSHEISFSADGFSSGIYFVEMQMEQRHSHQRILLIR